MSAEQVLGLVTGMAFGFLLQKGEVLRFERQVGFMLLKDMTIIKFMVSAVLVGMVGIQIAAAMGLIALKLKGTVLGAQIIGGSLFGIGWAIAGYCPGTSVGAVAEGRWHALWAILGMLIGAGVYAEVYPAMKTSVLTWGNFGKISLPQFTGISTWLLILAWIGGGSLALRWIERKGL